MSKSISLEHNLIPLIETYISLKKKKDISAMLQFQKDLFCCIYGAKNRDTRLWDFTKNCFQYSNKSSNHYICLRTVGNRNKKDEFFFDLFLPLKEFDYIKQNDIIMFNNYAGLETYLYIYELSESNLSKPIKASFLAFTVDGENYINPTNSLHQCIESINQDLKEQLISLDMKVPIVTYCGENKYQFFVYLERTINLSSSKMIWFLDTFYKKAENYFDYKLRKTDFILMPGSKNMLTQTEISKSSFVYGGFDYNNTLQLKEPYFERCYFLSTSRPIPIYKEASSNLSKSSVPNLFPGTTSSSFVVIPCIIVSPLLSAEISKMYPCVLIYAYCPI